MHQGKNSQKGPSGGPRAGLDALHASCGPERGREHLAQSLAGVQGDMTVMQGKVQAVEAIAGTGSGGGERSSGDDGTQAAHAGAEAILNCAGEETGADYQGAGTQTRLLRKRSKQLKKSSEPWRCRSMGTRCLSRGSAGQRGSLKDLEFEFATGTVWYRQHKVASAAAEKPRSGEAVGAGWADVKLLAKVMRLQ